jgi:hypothetical protein
VCESFTVSVSNKGAFACAISIRKSLEDWLRAAWPFLSNALGGTRNAFVLDARQSTKLIDHSEPDLHVTGKTGGDITADGMYFLKTVDLVPVSKRHTNVR